MLNSKPSLTTREALTTKRILEELRRAEEDEGAMQRHLQRIKDPKGLEKLEDLRDNIARLEARLDTADK